MESLFLPMRRPHTVGSEAIQEAVTRSRASLQLLRAQELRAGALLQAKTLTDKSVTPALFASVDLPRLPDKPVSSRATAIRDDSEVLWDKLMKKHGAGGRAGDGGGSLVKDAVEYKELYIVHLGSRSSKRVNATLAAHGSEAPLPTYDRHGAGRQEAPTVAPVFADFASRGHARPLSAFANSHGQSCEPVVQPAVQPVPVLDMGLDGHDTPGAPLRRRRRASTATAATTARQPTSGQHPHDDPSKQQDAARKQRGSARHGGSLPGTGGDDNEGEDASPAAPTFQSVNEHDALFSIDDAGGAAGAAVPTLTDSQLKPVATKLNIDICRIQEQLLKGHKLSAALSKSLTAIRRAYRPPAEKAVDRSIEAILRKHTQAAQEKQRVQGKRPTVSAEGGRLHVGHTRLSAEKTYEIHALQDINPGLGTALAATIRNTQVQGGRVRRASVQFHTTADEHDAAASNAIERRQHEHFLARPHRDAALSEVLSIQSMKTHITARRVAVAAGQPHPTQQLQEQCFFEQRGPGRPSTAPSPAHGPRQRAASITTLGSSDSAGQPLCGFHPSFFLTEVPGLDANSVDVNVVDSNAGSAGMMLSPAHARCHQQVGSGGTPSHHLGGRPGQLGQGPSSRPAAHHRNASMVAMESCGSSSESAFSPPDAAFSAFSPRRGGSAATGSASGSATPRGGLMSPRGTVGGGGAQRPQTAPMPGGGPGGKLARSGSKRSLKRESSQQVIEDIDAVNTGGALSSRRSPRKLLLKTISADIRPGQGSTAQVMLSMRLRAQVDALKVLSGTFDAIERALRALRVDRRLVGLSCVDQCFLSVAHAAAVSEVVLDTSSLEALAQQLHADVCGLSFVDVLRFTEVVWEDIAAAMDYLRATGDHAPAAGSGSGSGGRTGSSAAAAGSSALGGSAAEFDDFADLDALRVADEELLPDDHAGSSLSPEKPPGGTQSRLSGASGSNLLLVATAKSLRSTLSLHRLTRSGTGSASAGSGLKGSHASSGDGGGGGGSGECIEPHVDSAGSAAAPHEGAPPGQPDAEHLQRSGTSGGHRSSSSSDSRDELGLKIPQSVLKKAEDFAAERYKASWPQLLEPALLVLRKHSGWGDAAYAAWLRGKTPAVALPEGLLGSL